MSSPGANGGRRRIPSWLIPVLGYGVSIACLVWVYYGFDWKSEWPKLRATELRWITVAVVLDIVVYVCQGFRWSLLLRPLNDTPVLKYIQAVYIGLFANEVLPLRSGEIIRCYLLKRWTGLSLPVVLSSALIERIMDGIWLVLGFYIVAKYVHLPGWLIGASQVLLVALVVFSVLLALAVLYKRHAHDAVAGSRWAKALRSVVDGVHAMGRSRTFAGALILSLIYLMLQVGPVYALMRGYGLDLGIGPAAAVLVILRLGTVIPQAPGNVGSFQFLTVVGLRLFEVDRATATGFATLLFLVVTVPLWLAGFVALVATRMRLSEIHRDAREQFDSHREAREAS
jgi:glycosyltransferase 2 family protein